MGRMTFQEYLNQSEPIKAHGVKVTLEDCEGIWPNNVTNTKLISLKVGGEFFSYVTKSNSNLMWTIDNDGNPKSPSCFILVRKKK